LSIPSTSNHHCHLGSKAVSLLLRRIKLTLGGRRRLGAHLPEKSSYPYRCCPGCIRPIRPAVEERRTPLATPKFATGATPSLPAKPVHDRSEIEWGRIQLQNFTLQRLALSVYYRHLCPDCVLHFDWDVGFGFVT
jgi:hypothetical protein